MEKVNECQTFGQEVTLNLDGTEHLSIEKWRCLMEAVDHDPAAPEAHLSV